MDNEDPAEPLMDAFMLLRRWELAILLFICRSGLGQHNGLVAYWPFDGTGGTAVVEAKRLYRVECGS
ncbi:MAG: hypothetical protein DMG76_20025 [Acidobacteria bacterium]|nr:MAG: hypothetical protein DMG76_20025 [Acidobacteriota bacterium]